jgi:hypothetical protein
LRIKDGIGNSNGKFEIRAKCFVWKNLREAKIWGVTDLPPLYGILSPIFRCSWVHSGFQTLTKHPYTWWLLSWLTTVLKHSKTLLGWQ